MSTVTPVESFASKTTSTFSPVEKKHSKASKTSILKKSKSRELSRTMSFRHEPSILDVALERYKSLHRATSCLDEAYAQLQVTTTLQYFREDYGGVTNVRLTPDGSRAAVGFTSGDMRVCRSNPLNRRESMQSNVVMRGWEGNHSVSCVRFLPSDSDVVYAASTSGAVYRTDLASSSKPETIIMENNNEIYSMDFSSDGRRLITGGRDGSIRVYNVELHSMIDEYTSKLRTSCPTFSLLDFEGHMHEKRVYCVKCHPEDENVIVTGGWDGVVKVWDMRCSHGWIRDIPGPYIFGEALDLKEGVVLTASYEASNSIQLWDFASGDLLQDVLPSNKRVSLVGEFPCAAQFFSGDPGVDLVLCGGLGTGGLQVISVKEASILYLFEDEKPVVAVDSVGNKIAFGGKSNSLLFGTIFASKDISERSAYSFSCTPRGSRFTTSMASSVVSFTSDLKFGSFTPERPVQH